MDNMMEFYATPKPNVRQTKTRPPPPRRPAPRSGPKGRGMPDRSLEHFAEEDDKKKEGLSGGAIAGIVIGVLALVGAGAYFYMKKKGHSLSNSASSAPSIDLNSMA